jgi:hypothetical protein
MVYIWLNLTPVAEPALSLNNGLQAHFNAYYSEEGHELASGLIWLWILK